MPSGKRCESTSRITLSSRNCRHRPNQAARIPTRIIPNFGHYTKKLITMDPSTGEVPYGRLEVARSVVKTKLAQPQFAPTPTAWTERGPNNIGGRTRAILFDPGDPDKKKVWAGGVSGGLWFNLDITDAGSSWVHVDEFLGKTWPSSSLAYDPSNPQVMYAGTGEYNQGTLGGGIWKNLRRRQ